MFRFRVRKIPGPLLKFTQKAVLFQDISIFFVLKTELYLSSGTYFFFWKLVFHFTSQSYPHYVDNYSDSFIFQYHKFLLPVDNFLDRMYLYILNQ